MVPINLSQFINTTVGMPILTNIEHLRSSIYGAQCNEQNYSTFTLFAYSN